MTFDNEVDLAVVTEYRLAIEQAERRLQAMDKQIAQAAELPLYRDHVAWLRCFHGIDTTIAMIFVAELQGMAVGVSVTRRRAFRKMAKAAEPDIRFRGLVLLD